ncbi:MAG TPA: hypothetical protein ACQGQF_05245, partial [Xylella fastidiosa subsp. pauca]
IGLERLDARLTAERTIDAQERWEHLQKQQGDETQVVSSGRFATRYDINDYIWFSAWLFLLLPVVPHSSGVCFLSS